MADMIDKLGLKTEIPHELLSSQDRSGDLLNR
jgi:hypothetical protein